MILLKINFTYVSPVSIDENCEIPSSAGQYWATLSRIGQYKKVLSSSEMLSSIEQHRAVLSGTEEH